MRILFRLLLAVSMLLALAVATVSLWKLGLTDPSAWASVAAALAVIAAVASAWTSQRVLELQEDASKPNPVPIIDVRSRYQLAQFRITNHGGASAHDVRITWQQQLRNAAGEEVLLGRDVAIPVIPERESASVLLGSSHRFFRAHQDTTCRGKILYTNASGRRYSKPFVISAEHERVSLVDAEEIPKTLFQLQKIPDELQHVTRELRYLRAALENSVVPASSAVDEDEESNAQEYRDIESVAEPPASTGQ